MAAEFSHKWILGELERERRTTVRRRLVELRGLVGDAYAERRAAITTIRVQCRRARLKLSERCRARVAAAKVAGLVNVTAKRGAVAAARADEARLRRADRPQRSRATAAERRDEGDQEVARNIDPSLHGVWAKVKKYIKGTPGRRTRTEAFLEWCEENPAEVYVAQAHAADRYLAQLLAEEAAHHKASKAARLTAEVPF